jgi:hypothetical protein
MIVDGEELKCYICGRKARAWIGCPVHGPDKEKAFCHFHERFLNKTKEDIESYRATYREFQKAKMEKPGLKWDEWTRTRLRRMAMDDSED